MVIIGGLFDDVGGRHSGYVQKIADELEKYCPSVIPSFLCINGGYFSFLEEITSSKIDQEVLLWFPSIPNEKEKLLRSIKDKNPSCILVSSKSNVDGKYSFHHLIARALQSKSNLLVEFTKDPVTGEHLASVFDPLGNAFCLAERDVAKIARAIVERVATLSKFTRVPSRQIGDAIPVPDEEEFFSIVRNVADRLHHLIHTENQDRFLGNASFRCENGFPSFKKNGVIFVSRRNLDKRSVGQDGFVAIDLSSTDSIKYYGDNKPSVDTPIQVRLYNHYPNVRYMIHTHAYIDGAPFTHSKIPCGAIEEFHEIASVLIDTTAAKMSINLFGHGSLIMSDDLAGLETLFISRQFPEFA